MATITITTEYGTFEAETEKEAKAKLRKAIKEAKEAAETRRLNSARSYEAARANGYMLLVRFMEDKDFPGGWTFYHADAKHVSWNVTYRHSYGAGNVPEIVWHGSEGKAQSDHYGYTFLGAVENGSGFPIAAFFQDNNNRERIESYAIGIYADQIAFVPLPGIKPEQFKQSKQND